MNTKQKIEIYRKYGGVGDGFTRFGQKSEKDLIQYNDWSMIDSVLHDLELLKKGLCSSNYKDKLENTIQQNFDIEAIDIIKNKI